MTIHKVNNKSGKILRRGLGSKDEIIAIPNTEIIQTSKLRRGLGKNDNKTITYISPSLTPDMWSPYYENPQIWLDGFDTDFFDLDSSNIIQWFDQSGNGRLVFQSDSSFRATYASNSLNGGGIVSFGGSKWFPNIGSFAAGSFFAVCQVPSAKAFAGLFTGSASELILNGTGLNAITTTGYNVKINGDNTTTIPVGSSYFIWSLTKTPSTQSRVIGQEFNLQGSGRSWDGGCAEIIAFSGQLTSGQVEIVEGYLAWKWGLTVSLPSGHSYKSSLPPYDVVF
jgi:hypothetical protein